jgi:hypothetical protein
MSLNRQARYFASFVQNAGRATLRHLQRGRRLPVPSSAFLRSFFCCLRGNWPAPVVQQGCLRPTARLTFWRNSNKFDVISYTIGRKVVSNSLKIALSDTSFHRSYIMQTFRDKVSRQPFSNDPINLFSLIYRSLSSPYISGPCTHSPPCSAFFASAFRACDRR